MVNFRKFQLSCKWLWGYNMMIDLDELETIADAIETILSSCHHFLEEHNLEELKDYLKSQKTGFHIHDTSLEQLLMTEPNHTVYICNH